MQMAGAMGWDTARFWHSTPREFRVVMNGWLMSKGVKIETTAERETRATRMHRMRDYMAQFCKDER